MKLFLLFSALLSSAFAERFACEENLGVTQQVIRSSSSTGDDAEAVVTCDNSQYQMIKCDCVSKQGRDDCDGSFIVVNNDGTSCVARNMNGGEGIEAVATCQALVVNCETPLTDMPITRCPSGYQMASCFLHSDIRHTITPKPTVRYNHPNEGDCATTSPCPRCQVTARCVRTTGYNLDQERVEASRIAGQIKPVSILPSLKYPCSKPRDLTLCEKTAIKLSCKDGEVIQVLSAMYGRQDLTTCLGENKPTTTTCSLANALPIAQGLCNGLQTCIVTSSSPPFLPDPCPSERKYLKLQYQCCRNCTRSPAKLTCQKESLRLSCPRDYLLDVTYAMWGRDSPFIYCKSKPFTTSSPLPCIAPNSLSVVQGLCQNQPNCAVTADTPSDFPTDPCIGTRPNYLRVAYQCCRKCHRQEDAQACEKSTARPRCPDGHVINVLDASYGRQDSSTCIQHTVPTVNCHAPTSLSVVSAACNGQQSCSVLAANSVFTDPCSGIPKYLTIKYECCKGTVKPHDEPAHRCATKTRLIYPLIKDCTVAKPIKTTICLGYCQSSAMYGFPFGPLRKRCHCCLPSQYLKRTAYVPCKNGKWQKIYYTDIGNCDCLPCK